MAFTMSTGVGERVNVVMKLFANGLPKFTQLRIYIHYSFDITTDL